MEEINLDLQSRVPIYEQIVTSIERYVALGILKANQPILSIRELGIKLGINPNTVKKAYSELENKGVIYAISTKGYYISEEIHDIIYRKKQEGINEINKIVSELYKLGISKDEIIKSIK